MVVEGTHLPPVAAVVGDGDVVEGSEGGSRN